MYKLYERDEDLNNKLLSFTSDLSLSDDEFLIDFQTGSHFSLQDLGDIIKE